jgi:hypothetical protein
MVVIWEGCFLMSEVLLYSPPASSRSFRFYEYLEHKTPPASPGPRLGPRCETRVHVGQDEPASG